ncbi:type VI secretion system baseplate subunit TssF [Erwinia amylovora]
MDYKFLEYYNKELTFMREMAHEFAVLHPKIARRLGMDGIEVADPYVERLIEAFCFISARTRLKLDAEFPNFTQRLLNIIYPNYNSPTPSMGVVQLTPNLKEGDLKQGYKVLRDSSFYSGIIPGEMTRCEYRNSQDVTLWPIEIVEASLTSVPPDMPNLGNHRIDCHKLKGALRIRLKLKNDLTFSQLEGLNTLPIYISGDERIASHIFELLHASNVATIVRSGHGEGTQNTVNSVRPLIFEGLDHQQSLLPAAWNIFHGHNMVHEYFSCRHRFYFFTVTQLSTGLKDNHTNEAEIIILLRQLSQDLVGHINADRFLLFCTPVINLFPKRLDRIEVKRSHNEFHVVPDRSRPMDFEVYSINKVSGLKSETSTEVTFNPLYQTRNSDNGNYGRYFSTLRKSRIQNTNQRRYETQTAYDGTEVYLSLVDQLEAPYSDDIKYLTVEAMVTNRDLPRLFVTHGSRTLSMSDAAPVSEVNFVCKPSIPREPFANSESPWRLIRQLNFNYLPLSDADSKFGGEAMRSMLRLFVANSDRDSNTKIDGLISCQTRPVTRRLPGNDLLVYGRGVRCTITVDEENFSGISPYLFGLIMQNYISRHASINVFTETELHSLQRGQIGLWEARPGTRGAF